MDDEVESLVNRQLQISAGEHRGRNKIRMIIRWRVVTMWRGLRRVNSRPALKKVRAPEIERPEE